MLAIECLQTVHGSNWAAAAGSGGGSGVGGGSNIFLGLGSRGGFLASASRTLSCTAPHWPHTTSLWSSGSVLICPHFRHMWSVMMNGLRKKKVAGRRLDCRSGPTRQDNKPRKISGTRRGVEGAALSTGRTKAHCVEIVSCAFVGNAGHARSFHST